MSEATLGKIDKKIDRLDDKLDTVAGHVGDIRQQLPNDETLQTVKTCQEKHNRLWAVIGALGVGIATLAGWLWSHVAGSAVHAWIIGK